MSEDKDRIEADLNESRHRLNDTLEALGQKLSPKDMAEDLIDVVRSEAGRVTRFAAHQVQQNPLPFALVAAGVVWLVLSNRSGRGSSSSSSKQPRRLADTHRSLSDEDWRVERQRGSLDEIASQYPRMDDESEDAYSIRTHQAYATALDLEPGANEDEDSFRERVKQTAQSMREKASQAGRELKHKVEGVTSRIGDMTSDVGGKATRFYDQSPLAAGAVALALGLIVGGATPLTTPERRVIRDAATRLKRNGLSQSGQTASMREGNASEFAH